MFSFSPAEEYMNDHQIIPGTALSTPEKVNILQPNSRAGHSDRDNAIEHIRQMLELGYLKDEEAGRRIDRIFEAERISDIQTLTMDLPAPIDTRNWVQAYNFNEPKYWIPTLVGGMAASTITAILPVAIMSTDHVFPNTSVGFAVGVSTLIIGVIGFLAFLITILAKV